MVMSSLIGLGVGAALSAGLSAAQGGSIGDILKSAGIGGLTGAATAGAGSAIGGSVAGLVGGGLSKVGSAIGGQAVKTAATEGVKSTLVSKIGTGLLNIGTKMSNFGASHGVGAMLSQGAKGGTATGGAASVESVESSVTQNGQIAQVLNIGDGGGKSVQIGSTQYNLPGPVKLGVPGAKSGTTPGSIPGNTLKYSIPANTGAKTGLFGKVANSKVGQGVKTAANNLANSKVGQGIKTAVNSKPGQAVLKGAGQYGVQGALSLLSMGQAAKQADAANQISQQSLLFQKQTYNEQIAEKESYKAGMKQTASTAYESARLFGSNLQGSDANNTLLTSYSTSGNGAIGDYSILTYSSSRTRDIT